MQKKILRTTKNNYKKIRKMQQQKTKKNNCKNQGLRKHQEVSSTPDMKLTKFIVVFWDILGAKKVNPESYVQCGSYELLVSSVAHQIKEK